MVGVNTLTFSPTKGWDNDQVFKRRDQNQGEKHQEEKKKERKGNRGEIK